MAELRSYDAGEIARRVSMGSAIDALRICFADRPSHIERASYPAAEGELLVMPAVHRDSAGIKLLMVQPRNAERGEPTIQGTYVLFDAERGCPVALFDGAALTRLRTPAVSAVATDALARNDVSSLGIIGAGPQALAHVEAMLCVRPRLDRIILANRNADGAHSLVHSVLSDPNLATLPGIDGQIGSERDVHVGSFSDAAACDIVCIATRSVTALVDAAMVRSGAHINAVGSYRADMCELAADVLLASTVIVDDVEAARAEAGDLIRAVASGAWSWDAVAGDLADVIAGSGRTRQEEITVFKSVGLAIEDLVIARLVAAADGLI